MGRIIYDESGKLLDGYFYRFGVPCDDDTFYQLEPDYNESWIVSKLDPTSEQLHGRGEMDWLTCQLLLANLDWDEEAQMPVSRDVVVRHDCPVSPDHVTHSRHKRYEADLSVGGARVSDFIIEHSDYVVVSSEFSRKLRFSGLSKFDLVPVTITVNQISDKDPGLLAMEFLGRNCERPRRVVDAPNACPYCGHKPLICEVCGYYPFTRICPGCRQKTAVISKSHGGQNDRRLKYESKWPKAGPILSGRWWDGSDFIGSDWRFVTKRVVDWLLSVHAMPFYAQPARVCIDGMTEEQLKRLEQARRPVGSC